MVRNNLLHTENAEQVVAQLQAQINDSAAQNKQKESAMFSWNLEQLCESTDGDIIGPRSESVNFTSISTDTRTLQPGALYIAIKGERFDGHAFIDQAIQQGAVAVLVSAEVDSIIPGVQVKDTRIALGEFARWHRQQMPVKTLIAITGSNGKTTTKSLLTNIFAKVGITLATEGNLNNDFGVPRTLLNLRPEHEFAIIEMGANHPHEIGYLTALALPDIAMINNASGAHLEGFGSLQGVIETKGEIFDGLNRIAGKKAGTAVINTDSPGYTDWLKRLKALEVNNIVRFGTDADAQVRVTDFKVADASAIAFTLNISYEQAPAVAYQVEMPVLGFHNAMNAAACT
ncbi:MAG: UDP-N-acetylmuramoyl-tripeptide--D-alanyl-D-alanine ligase, partial [Thiomicrorhabdus sp.]|nr:UDP-N-acetylmuramoyl-tripeptide--D-alanyl-D-alanine ligase [Thiomicrorhabdus sp.]